MNDPRFGSPAATVTNGTFVLVRQVSLHGNPSFSLAPAPQLIKFSREKHAPHHAAELQLATPQYYRTYEGQGADTRDELEAQYRENRPDALTDEGFGSVFRGLHPPSLSVTFGVSGLWLYCTSVQPNRRTEVKNLRGRFGAEAVTVLGEPAALAQALGDAVVTDPESGVRSDEGGLWAILQRHVLRTWSSQLAAEHDGPGGEIQNVVWVDHGAVLYSDAANRLLDDIDPTERPRAVPFIKRSRYEWQREYRFVVSTIGMPSEAAHRIPIPAGLRSLTAPWTGQ